MLGLKGASARNDNHKNHKKENFNRISEVVQVTKIRLYRRTSKTSPGLGFNVYLLQAKCECLWYLFCKSIVLFTTYMSQNRTCFLQSGPMIFSQLKIHLSYKAELKKLLSVGTEFRPPVTRFTIKVPSQDIPATLIRLLTAWVINYSIIFLSENCF